MDLVFNPETNEFEVVDHIPFKGGNIICEDPMFF